MVRFRTEVQILFPRLGDFGCTLRIMGNWRFAEYFGCGNPWCLSCGNDLTPPGNTQQCKPASNLTHVSVDVDSKGVQSPISVGPACRAGLRGHAATSDESRSKEASRGDVERMCVPRRFALRPNENPFRQKGPTLTIIRDCTLRKPTVPQANSPIRMSVATQERWIECSSKSVSGRWQR